MTREEIANFPYNAMAELIHETPALHTEYRKEGFRVDAKFISREDDEYNGKFKLAARRLFDKFVKPNDELFMQFGEICLKQKRKRAETKHFIAIISITDVDSFEKTTKCDPTINGVGLIKDAINKELEWAELHGISVRAIRPATQEEIKDI